MEKCKNQQRSRINKAFEKIPRFDGTNPSYCFDWLEQTEALVNEHQGRIYREELLLNWDQHVQDDPHTATGSYQSAHQRYGIKKPFQPQNHVAVIKCLSSATSEAR